MVKQEYFLDKVGDHKAIWKRNPYEIVTFPVLEFDCANFGRLTTRLIELRVFVEDACNEEERGITSDALAQNVLEQITALLLICEESELGDCRYQLLSMKARLEFKRERPTFKEMAEDIRLLEHTAFLETSKNVFLVMPHHKTEFYKEEELFGKRVADNFASANYDVEQAGNCFALGQHTATVMHLMRVLEVALDALGRTVGIPDLVERVKHNWTAALKDIGERIGQNDKGNVADWTHEKSQFCEEARAHLFAVKRSFRDRTMHLEKKYEEPEARRIFNAVKDFMEHLAERLEQGGRYTSVRNEQVMSGDQAKVSEQS